MKIEKCLVIIDTNSIVIEMGRMGFGLISKFSIILGPRPHRIFVQKITTRTQLEWNCSLELPSKTNFIYILTIFSVLIFLQRETDAASFFV